MKGATPPLPYTSSWPALGLCLFLYPSSDVTRIGMLIRPRGIKVRKSKGNWPLLGDGAMLLKWTSKGSEVDYTADPWNMGYLWRLS